MPAHRLRPSYQIVATLLLVIASLGLAFKLLSRYLPEAQPNLVAREYSTFLQVVGRQKVDWFPYSAEAFEQAQSLDRLIYMEVGSLFSRYSNIVADRFYNDEEFVRLLNSHFISIRVDIDELPAVALALAANTSVFVDAGGALFVVLTPEGYTVEATQYRQLRSSREPLGMYEWLSDHARNWVVEKGEVRESAKNRLERQASLMASSLQAGAVSVDTPEEFAAQLAVAFDSGTGRIGQRPAPLCPAAPALLLSVRRTAVEGRRWVQALRISASYDHLRGGFFDDSPNGWWSPTYGKRVGRSAQLASVLAAASSNGDLLSQAARQTTNWIRESAVGDDGQLYGVGLSTDELVLEGSRYYDFTTVQLPPNSPFRIGATRSTGPPYLTESRMTDPADLIAQAAEVLNRVAEGRQPPMFDPATYTDDNARTISGLALTGIMLGESALLAVAELRLRRLLLTRVHGLGDVDHAPSGRAKTTGFSGDYVWLVRAILDVYRGTGDRDLLEIARRITSRARELFATDTGLLLTRLKSEKVGAFEIDVVNLADDWHESINSVWIRNLQDLAGILADTSHHALARNALQSIGTSAPRLGVGGAGLMRALYEHFRPIVLVSAPDPTLFSIELQRRRFGILVAPNPVPNDPVGYHWVEAGVKQGPFTLAEIEARLRLSEGR